MRMPRLWMCLSVVAIVFAVSAASAAAAAPEFGRCVKTTGGKFKNAKCTIASAPGEERYEWFPGVVKNKFSIFLKPSTLMTLENVGGSKFTCSDEHGEGEYNSAKSVSGVVLRLEGCTESGASCETGGAGAGTIVTSALEGVLGVETEAANPVNNHLALELHAPEGKSWATFSCPAGIARVLRGAVLHPIIENTMQLTETEKYAAAKGIQKPDHFAGEAAGSRTLEESSNGGPFERFGYTSTSVLTNEESIEASTVN